MAVANPKSKKVGTQGWNLKNQKGNWKPMDLVWEESSGAVAPEFRYGKQYRLVAGQNKILLTRKVSRANKQILNETKEISSKLYQSWMQKLSKTGIASLTFESPPTETITGVSYNFVSFQLGSTKSRFYYRLEERKESNWKQKNTIIEIIERMEP
ncbi:permease [Leptospira perdikensis]|uniref:Permease n=1 Tax=Leptospira perdikensis TaxID=2484948 RepID=A0A4R9JEQ5_9LEPT|nr:permease [Leptospira perdikensis]TGL39046.1 permease [Leptospira perdikensis]